MRFLIAIVGAFFFAVSGFCSAIVGASVADLRLESVFVMVIGAVGAGLIGFWSFGIALKVGIRKLAALLWILLGCLLGGFNIVVLMPINEGMSMITFAFILFTSGVLAIKNIRKKIEAGQDGSNHAAD
jgi:hypothetical protein